MRVTWTVAEPKFDLAELSDRVTWIGTVGTAYGSGILTTVVLEESPKYRIQPVVKRIQSIPAVMRRMRRRVGLSRGARNSMEGDR